MKFCLVDKPVSKTPFQMVVEFKHRYPEFREVKVGYAGRLDPIACGLLILLIGEECKNREFYQNKPKEYITQVMIGVNTDTDDILGFTNGDFYRGDLSKQKIETELAKFQGKIRQKYHKFSAKAIGGTPLFKLSRLNVDMENIKIPERELEIYQIQLTDWFVRSSNKVLPDISERILNLAGDFRQNEIIDKWRQIFPKDQPIQFFAFHATVESGTYIRSIVAELSKRTEIPMTVFEIRRTKIGEYTVEESIKLS